MPLATVLVGRTSAGTLGIIRSSVPGVLFEKIPNDEPGVYALQFPTGMANLTCISTVSTGQPAFMICEPLDRVMLPPNQLVVGLELASGAVDPDSLEFSVVVFYN